ncbi:hypothetical protein RI129_001571 [Pyrocoelia pectoralis]|uniref:Uncharacterized protein n=1 Tax=Pyrocoelia pectoralis TaxID=417401 RepID=A0AAN7ZPT2_9COLE
MTPRGLCFILFLHGYTIHSCESKTDGSGEILIEKKGNALDLRWILKVKKCLQISTLQCFYDLVINEGDSRHGKGSGTPPEDFDVGDVIEIADAINESRKEVTEKRKLKLPKNGKKVLPFLIVPGLVLAGILPWIVPQLKIVVMAVGLINQIALSSAIFSFLRSYIFDKKAEEHIFYINHGYKNSLKLANDVPVRYHTREFR